MQIEHKINVLVSVVIPVFNKLKYLPDCIKAVRNQSYSNWECIFVDDGSTDGSSNFLQQLCHEDCRFRLVSQSNQGVGVARNTGLNAVEGDFFCFIDADDLVSPHYIAVFLDAYKKAQCSLIVADYDNDSNDVILSHCDIANIVDNVQLNRNNLCQYLRSVHTGPWGKLYCASVFKNLRFPNLRGAEDIYAHADIIQRAEKLVIIKNKLYYWQQISNSTSHAKNFDNRLIYCDALAQCVLHWLSVTIMERCPTYEIRSIIQYRLHILVGFVVRSMWYDKNLSVVQKNQLVEKLRVGLLQINNDIKNYFLRAYLFFGRWCVLSLFIKSSKLFRLGFEISRISYCVCKLMLGRKV